MLTQGQSSSPQKKKRKEKQFYFAIMCLLNIEAKYPIYYNIAIVI